MVMAVDRNPRRQAAAIGAKRQSPDRRLHRSPTPTATA